MIEIYYSKIDNITISEFGRSMAKNSLNEDANRQSAAAWSLLEKILIEKHSIFVCKDDIFYNENDKPYFKNNMIYFNISHSNEYVLVGVSDCEIGVDVEKIEAIEHQDSIAKWLLNEEERKEYLSTGDKLDLLIKYWVMKEALCKMHGKRLAECLKLHPSNVFVERIGDYYFGYINEKNDKFQIEFLS